jgi:hypothetical protein
MNFQRHGPPRWGQDDEIEEMEGAQQRPDHLDESNEEDDADWDEDTSAPREDWQCAHPASFPHVCSWNFPFSLALPV